MIEEVKKYIHAYHRDEKRAWYEIDKMWVAKLHRNKQMYHDSGEDNFRNWRFYVSRTQCQMREYEAKYGDQDEEWEWNAKY